jgi:hypothetical protein
MTKLYKSLITLMLTVIYALGVIEASEIVPSSVKSPNTLRHVVISSNKLKSLSFDVSGPDNRTYIIEIPSYNTDAFGQIMSRYYSKPINNQLVTEIISAINSYSKQNCKVAVRIFAPKQDFSNGTVRLLAIFGDTPLKYLYLNGYEQELMSMRPNSIFSEILVNNLPDIYRTREFAETIGKLIGTPICNEAVDYIISEISNYVSSKGSVLAAAQVPLQKTSAGEVRLVLVPGKFVLKKLILSTGIPSNKSSSQLGTDNIIITDEIPIYSTPAFKKYISTFIDKAISVELLPALKQSIIQYGSKNGLMLVDVSTPFVDLQRGELRFGVLISKYDKLHFKGNRWFSDKLLTDSLGLKTGQVILISDLDSAIAWANRNPFRQIQVTVDNFNKPFGLADLDITVNEAPPFRFTLTYNDYGYSQIGYNEFTGSATVGNLWGKDQQLVYQYTTTDKQGVYQAQNIDYKMPLPWRHILDLSLGYSLVATKSLFGIQGFNEKGKNFIADINYTIPINFPPFTADLTLGLDFKSLNTNLQFGDFIEPIGNYDVAELSIATTLLRNDRFGDWSFGFKVNFSPGNFDSLDNNAYYGFDSAGSPTNRKSRYLYATIVVERATNLPKGFQFISRATLQSSTTNLQASEQLGIGGVSSVRAFTQHYQGDQGLILNEEIRTPFLEQKISFVSKKWPTLRYQLVGFLDYGKISTKHPIFNDINYPPLMSSGIGLRAGISANFNLSADYGWQLKKGILGAEPRSNRGDIQASFSY